MGFIRSVGLDEALIQLVFRISPRMGDRQAELAKARRPDRYEQRSDALDSGREVRQPLLDDVAPR